MRYSSDTQVGELRCHSYQIAHHLALIYTFPPRHSGASSSSEKLGGQDRKGWTRHGTCDRRFATTAGDVRQASARAQRHQQETSQDCQGERV